MIIPKTPKGCHDYSAMIIGAMIIGATIIGARIIEMIIEMIITMIITMIVDTGLNPITMLRRDIMRPPI